MRTPKASLLEQLIFPRPVASHLIDSQAFAFVTQLSANYSLGPALAKLTKFQLTSDAAQNLASAPYYEVADALLDTKESRVGVLQLLLSCWDMSASDQLRFVTRSLKEATADYVLSLDSFTKEAKAVAVRRASPASAHQWLLYTDLDDASVLDILKGLVKSKKIGVDTILSILYLRPGLRDMCAASTEYTLVAATAWVPLKGEAYDQRWSTLTRDPQKIDANARLGLLLQPSLKSAHRAKLYEDANSSSYQSVRNSIYYYGLPGLEDPVWVGAPLSSVTDQKSQVDVLTYLAASRFPRPAMRVLRTLLLAELSSAISDPLIARRLVAQVTQEPANTPVFYGLTTEVASNVEAMAERVVSPEDSPRTILGDSWSNSTSWRRPSISSPTPPASTLPRRQRPLEVSAPFDPAHSTSPNWVYQSSPRYISSLPDDLGSYLEYRLGDGSTESSKHQWMMFLDFFDSHPDQTISRLCDLVCSLTH